MSEPVTDFTLLVTVRVYGQATVADAVQALLNDPATFELPGDREAEIVDAQEAS